jgi:hypothetical protein
MTDETDSGSSSCESSGHIGPEDRAEAAASQESAEAGLLSDVLHRYSIFVDEFQAMLLFGRLRSGARLGPPAFFASCC